ncbi:hypothetical protein [Bacillus licheniformis]|uniref:hypothetical protein n=1 Tax=Bacillus licheniformis TaxID=1402 RepID=UPI000371E3AC|nr:hypothetical protein [Bacillus licheniformis]
MRETKTTKETMRPITVLQADIIFKALYYVARNEGLEITEELTEIYKVLAEDNPRDSDVSETLDVMENRSDRPDRPPNLQNAGSYLQCARLSDGAVFSHLQLYASAGGL